MNKKRIKNIEWSILICVILLMAIGLVALYSATYNSEFYELKKQCMWILISLPIMIIMIFIDYEMLAKISPYLYGIAILLLIAVLFTSAINGATSWFYIGNFSFQPAEISKVFVILFLSYTIVNIQKNSQKEINKPLKLAIILGIIILPVLLIAIQPDYGTAIGYMLALVLMLFVAGINKKYIIVSILVLLIALPLMYFFVLPSHAKSRIDVFLNPNLDPRGAGYNIIQSKIAIRSRKTFWNGNSKRNANSFRILIS